MERETGIEPATNSLEGCDSTTELLPPMSRPSSALAPSLLKLPINWVSSLSPPSCGGARSAPCRPARFISKLPINWVSLTSADNALALSAKRCCGEGRVRTSVGTRPADLQSAAIDRSATSPLSRRSLICWSPCFRRVPEDPLRTMNSGAGSGRGSLRWSWRRDLNPRPADYKSAALPD